MPAAGELGQPDRDVSDEHESVVGAGVQLTVLTAEPGSHDAQSLQLLAAWSASNQEPAKHPEVDRS
jgi:hypothetical protein